ncbi:hypothetical protein B9T28_12880 [Acinetobacter silvestris]|uniref:Uncharacterized protein n=2 Tax=Acinetobacter silvestris TaxID=1977882 RepID=A0A1Y3CE16_9GAMM|nr:hypothetical protein B9T28_12880 [Acinetobacter silvestris]
MLILTAIFVSACSDKVQDQKEMKDATQSIKTKQSTHAEKNDHTEFSCGHLDFKQTFGFNEYLEEPKCDVLEKFNLISYKCEVSKNAFGADRDAILLENKKQRIFIYSNLKDCNNALEIRNSNGP